MRIIKNVIIIFVSLIFYKCGTNENKFENNNSAPISVDDSILIFKNTVFTSFNVITNDYDSDGDELFISSISTNGSGSISVNPDGVSIDYTPKLDYIGSETISYVVSDGMLTANAKLEITIIEIKDNKSIIFSVRNGDDPYLQINQDRISDSVWITGGNSFDQILNVKSETVFSKIESPKGTLWSHGSMIDKDELVFDKFSVLLSKIDDIKGKDLVMFLEKEQRYVQICFVDWNISKNGGFSYVRGVSYKEPVPIEDSISIIEDSDLISTNVVSNDIDSDNNDLTLVQLSTDGLGTVSINSDGVSIDYIPAKNFNGIETISYTVSNGFILSNSGLFVITVSAVNDAPVAVDDSKSILRGTVLTSTNVIANDIDVDDDELRIQSVTTNGTGTISVNSDGVSIDYTPENGFTGVETITYIVTDDVSVDTGLLIMNVEGSNTTPIAVDDTAKIPMGGCSTRINVTANDTDADNDALNITEVSTSGTGTVSLNNDGVSVDYTPASGFTGVETITYTVSDGSLSDATGTVTITVAEADYERTISFSKAAGADPIQAANQDRITDLVWITRGDESLIYNAVLETAANKANSPKGTLWAEGNIEDRCSLTFDTLDNTVPRKKLIVGKNLVMFLIEEQKYISIKFTSWGVGNNGGGGEFTYIRSAVFE